MCPGLCRCCRRQRRTNQREKRQGPPGCQTRLWRRAPRGPRTGRRAPWRGAWPGVGVVGGWAEGWRGAGHAARGGRRGLRAPLPPPASPRYITRRWGAAAPPHPARSPPPPRRSGAIPPPLLTSSPSFKIVTLCPSSSSLDARCRPRKAWPPPLVLAMSTESARAAAGRARRARAGDGGARRRAGAREDFMEGARGEE